MSSMKYLIYLFILFFLACSPKFRVQSDTPHPGNFTTYHTFKFYNPANMPGSNFSFEEQDQKMIFDAISDELKLRGYQSVQEADLMIMVQGGTKNTMEIQNDYYGSPYDYNRYYYNGFGRYNDYYDRQRNQSKKETILIVDVIDNKTDKIVWQGVATGELGSKDELTGEEIKTAIAAIFAQYPQTPASP
ncbi:MAG: DUF4136 domain-containing protein [Cyclobacteriaceae bacterium]|nr:DUF4136 domain-containing protein [Cyclobacteriaceae bacterium]